MSIKNVVIRKKINSTLSEIIYPVTSVENVVGLSSILENLNNNHNLNIEDITNLQTVLDSVDKTFVGSEEPSSNLFTDWLKVSPGENEYEIITPPLTGNEIITQVLTDNEIETQALTGNEIITPPLLDEIESGELKGDEIITPPQFE